MNLTNKYGLPEALVRAVSRDYHRAEGDISVTQLISPPRIHQLRLRHADEIVEDVSDRLWMLLGSAVHSVLERAAVPEALQEEYLSMDLLGWTVTGSPDYYYGPGEIRDYKITSVWAVIDGVPRPEWAAQLNVYAELYRSYGFPVIDLQICALLRDWSRTRAKARGNYPPVPFARLPVELWEPVAIRTYLTDRLLAHQEAVLLRDEDLPICTPEECWERPTTFAVMKSGNKRATKVCGTIEEAQSYIARLGVRGKKGTYQVVERAGTRVRCEDYCNVNKWCNCWLERL